MTTTDKEKLRQRLLDERAALSPETVMAASQAALENIRALGEWKNAREVLLYWPIKNEVDVRPLITELWQRDVRVLLPRCRPDATGEMDIACAACEDELKPGPFSIMEPDADSCPPLGMCRPDLAIIPGVGFDRKGYRIGFGGGYYDRLLCEEDMQNTLTIGVGYNFQLIDELPIEPWDKSVRFVCTEEELWRP